jgi:DNA repair exonuclease SbcCD ATPase subunit
MVTDPASDVVRWVQDGERLFGQALRALQRAEALAKENQRLRDEVQAMREELGALRAERLEAAETLKTFAEHVTQVATLALQRLGKRAG